MFGLDKKTKNTMLFNNLSKDLLLYLLKSLDIKTIYNVVQINKKLKNIINLNYFWMNKLINNYGIYGHLPKKILQNEYSCNFFKNNWKLYYKKIYNFQNVPKSNMSDCFLMSARSGDVNNVLILLNDTRVNIGIFNNYAFKSAIKKNHINVVKILLNDKRIYNNVDLKNICVGDSCKIGNYCIVKLLLNDKNIDPSINNNQAIKLAYKNNDFEIIKMLLSNDKVEKSLNIKTKNKYFNLIHHHTFI